MLKTKEQKNTFRKKIRKLRASKDQHEQQAISNLIVETVSSSQEFIKAKKIAIYHAVNGEADPIKLTQQSKSFHLPILADNPNEGLVFAPINSKTKYKNNKFLIPEPVCIKNDLCTGDSLDLVIVPLVGFDQKGNRIGMGGGFYDRTFSFKRETVSKPILMGFAFDFQGSEDIYQESWDVPLEYIATESQLIDTRSSND